MSCNTKTKTETTAIKLMIKKAMLLLLTSSCFAGISSVSLINVLVDRQANTINSPNDNTKPATCAPLVCAEIRYAINKEMQPEIPPEANAVLALNPINITAETPQVIKNNP